MDNRKVKPEKFILDATAGYRMMWFNKQHPNTIYLDERPECEPDIIGDFRELKQFKNETFNLIIFDPPHIIESSQTASNIIRDYGCLQKETWPSLIKDGARELWRLLKPMGVLLFKWSNQYIPSNQVIKLFPEKPLIYQISANKDKYSKRKVGARNRIKNIQTLWFCFMKIPEENKKDE